MVILRKTMPMKYTVTLTSVGTSSVVVIPKPILEGFGLTKGQKLEMIVTDDGIRIPLRSQSIREPKVKEDKVHG
jgi:bifunctional DNA-binding transcriptional regulator/antitoxin component of YhaV-PrlF toxin-antitoxin module